MKYGMWVGRMKLNEAKSKAASLYEKCDEVPGAADFSFPSWLLSLSDQKWDNVGEILTDEKRARCALNDVQYFCKVFGPMGNTG